jgi:hypothetical protein
MDDRVTELREAARQFHNLTVGDIYVRISTPSAEKRDAVVAAGQRLRDAIAALPTDDVEPAPQ